MPGEEKAEATQRPSQAPCPQAKPPLVAKVRDPKCKSFIQEVFSEHLLCARGQTHALGREDSVLPPRSWRRRRTGNQHSCPTGLCLGPDLDLGVNRS